MKLNRRAGEGEWFGVRRGFPRDTKAEGNREREANGGAGVENDKQQINFVGKMPESSLILYMPIIICKITSKVGKVNCHGTGEKPSIKAVS